MLSPWARTALVVLSSAIALPHVAVASAATDHSCLILPGSWSHATRSFAIGAGDEVGRLTQVSKVDSGVWHQRAAVHPTGPYAYVAASLDDSGSVPQSPRVFGYSLERERCELGALLQVTGPETDSVSGLARAPPSQTRRRYYGLELHPNGRYLYQTTEAWREIRLFRVGDDGRLTFVESYDVTRGGEHVCDHARRLEIHPDGRTLYSNCNNEGAGDGAGSALQAWRIGDDGRLHFLEHHVAAGMGGVFDPTVHPNGRWLYHPMSNGRATVPEDRGAYVLVYHIGPDGRLRHHRSIRVGDSDRNGSDSTRVDGLNIVALPTTVLLHPDGSHAYVTLHDQLDFAHSVVIYRVDPEDGNLIKTGAVDLVTTGTGNHHGGVLANRDGRLFLYTFVNVFPPEEGSPPSGFLEQFQIGSDYLPAPLAPRRVPTGLVDARHPVVVTAADPGGGREQRANPAFDPTVRRPAYAPDSGPRVLFDDAHHNFHRSDGRYEPFVRLMVADGFRVAPNGVPFTPESLAGHDILVISSARGAPSGQPGQADAAFTPAEVDAVHDWVRSGGALLLITDHPPAATPPRALAERFGIELVDAAPRDSLHFLYGPGSLVFSRPHRTLEDHPITRGRDDEERIQRVVTFTGNSIVPPPGAAVLLRLPRSAVESYPRPSAGDTVINVLVPAAGSAQGLALRYGRGRVVALGEAAAWTSQNFGSGAEVTGMDEAGFDNRQFILNTMRWMGGLLPADVITFPAPQPDFDPALDQPTFEGAGPRVAIDAAHHNLFTADGRFAPLAALLTADGYRMASLGDRFTRAGLGDVDVLVVGGPRAAVAECATALHWFGPADCPAGRPAFSATELEAVEQWVRAGGALLLALDPFPSGSAARELAGRFGVETSGGHALDWTHAENNAGTWIRFDADSGTIAQHAITQGVRRVVVFTSTSLAARRAAGRAAVWPPMPLLTFAPPAVQALPARARGDTLEIRHVPVDGNAAALVMRVDRGRVAVLGDADMLTSQLFSVGDAPVGLKGPPGHQNLRFALQLFRWLAGR